MNESEISTGKKSKFSILLYNLPDNVLENICQLLIDDASSQECLGHVRTLRDVMSLRASCSRFNDVIKEMDLKLPCSVTSDWENLPTNQNYFNFIDFMRTETNRRFRSLHIKAKMMMKDNDLIPFFHQNENLFYKSLTEVKVWLNMASYYETITDVLFDWLKRVAMKSDTNVELYFSTLNFNISEPEVVTTLVVNEIEDGEIPSQLWRYSNLTELRLCDAELQVESLTNFPNLRVLEVENLYMSEKSTDSSSSKFTTMKSLIIGSKRTINAAQLPVIISMFFPCLVYFEFSGYLNAVDFSSLPRSCIFLRTRLTYLRYFAKSSYIRNLWLHYDGELAPLRTDIDPASLELSVLKVSFENSRIPLCSRDLRARIIHLLKMFKSVEVLSISLSFGRNSKAKFPLKKLDWGEIDSNFLTTSFRFPAELKKLCRESNLQLLILGKTALMKKSTGSDLLKNVDSLEFDCGWILRPGPGVIMPLELLIGS